MGFREPFSRLKWGFLPTERQVEDYPDADFKEVEENDNQQDIQVEYRDEANRPWWKFFDEYEYRINKSTRKKHKWYKWFNETDSPAEKKLILKLDLLLTFYSCMAYWVKNLDQSNLNNAYVSGMKEELGFQGNDLVNTQVMFTIGTVIFQLPAMFIFYRLPLNYILPILDLLWSAFTIGSFKVQNVSQLKALRFFIGTFEAPGYLGYQFLFGSFYKYDEIVRRSMFYYCGQYCGILSSSLLQAKIYSSLNGVNGLSGWRWMMIIDGIISLFVGILGIYMLPGTPEKCYSIWLTDDEIRLARKRLRSSNINSDTYTRDFFKKETWIEIFTNWRVYILVIWNIFCWNNNNASSGSYLLWVKSLKRYSIPKVNQLGAITPGLGLIYLWFTALYADLLHSRWQALILTQIFNFMGNVILAAWFVPEGAKWYAFMLQYTGWAMAPVLYSWANDICRRNKLVRAITLVIMNILANTTTAFMSVLVWKTVDQPRYKKGFTWTAVCAFCLSLWTFVVLYFYKRDEKRFAKENGIIIFNSKTGENYPVEEIKVDISSKEAELNSFDHDSTKVKS